MTPGMARELLGVDENVSADALRRAYLRRIKQHGPERDPEGFREAREAYECLARLTKGAEARRATSEPATSERAASAPATSERAASEPATSERAASEPADIEDRTTSEDAPGAMEEARLPLELDDELDDEGDDELDDELDDEGDLADLEDERAHRRARDLLDEGAYDEAADVAVDAVASSRWPAAFWLDVFFRLVEEDELGSARRVLLAIQRTTEDRHEAVRLASGMRLRLVLASELSAVARALPDHLTQVIAAGLGTGTVRDIDAAFEQYGRSYPTRARDAKALLERDAPQLAARFGAHLAAAPRHRSRSSPLWLGVAVVLALLRVLSTQLGARPDPPRVERLVADAHARLDESIEIRPRDGEPMVCTGTRRACRLFSDATYALDEGRCYDALRALDRFDAQFGEREGELARLRGIIDARVVEQCLERESPTGTTELP